MERVMSVEAGVCSQARRMRAGAGALGAETDWPGVWWWRVPPWRWTRQPSQRPRPPQRVFRAYELRRRISVSRWRLRSLERWICCWAVGVVTVMVNCFIISHLSYALIVAYGFAAVAIGG